MLVRNTIEDISKKKKFSEKITMLTAYDYQMATLIDKAMIDIILVGDSLANVVLGLKSTREIGMTEMLHHAKAVNRGVKNALVIGDMPYDAYQINPQNAVANAKKFVEEAGCDAVKVEWGDNCLEVVEAIIAAGIPVMGHVGLTPQTADKLGGFKVQGKDTESAKKIILQAKSFQDKGCFSIVLECIPSQLAQIITQELHIPTIGIGAGVHCDGQVMVTNDLLGLFNGHTPKFVKRYINLSASITEALHRYRKEVVLGQFPDKEHSYSIVQHKRKKSPRNKQLHRALVRNVMISLRCFIRHLPTPVFCIFAKFFMAIGYCFMVQKRRIAIESLSIAFGNEKSEKERKKIANDYFDNFGRGMIDLIYLIDRPHLIKDSICIEGKEHLDRVLQQGNGAILVSAHFGNFILMYMKMVQEGYKTNVIMRRTRDPEFEKYISDFRDSRGLKTIYDLPARKCVQQSLKALRGNEILFILLDQNYGREGRVFVDFFGRQAATATGPVIFSTRTKAPILPIFIMRDAESHEKKIKGIPSDHHKIIIEPPVTLEQGKDAAQDVVTNIGKLTKIIEGYIRRYPHEWGGWMHKRWKSRTLEEQSVIDQLNEKGMT